MDPFSAGSRPKVLLLSGSPLPVQCDKETFHIKAEATPDDSPLARLQVLVNGVPWPDQRGISLLGEKSGKPIQRDIEVPLSDGNNRVQLSAVDATGMESLRQTIQVERLRPRHRGVRLLAVGVSAYADKRWNLKYAAPDAEAMRGLVSGSADPGCEVRVRVLTNAEATLEGIRSAAHEVFRDTTPDDLAILFLAGHGVLEPDQHHTWSFCPYDYNFGAQETRGLAFNDV